MITLDQAVKVFGTKTKLAAALGVSKGVVNHWQDSEAIPLKHQVYLKYDLRRPEFSKSFMSITE